MFTTILIVLGVLSAIIGTIISYKNAKGTELGKKFLRIAVGDEQAEYVLKQGNYVIIKDAIPAASHHYLALPTKSIRDVHALTPDDLPLLNDMMAGIRTVLAESNIEEEKCLIGFVMPPFNQAHHLHMHCVLKELNTCEAARKWVYSNFFAPYDEVIEKLNQLKKNKKD
jgi:diadenosine tetraphosphate (Ap4A) HIT family hydrolase